MKHIMFILTNGSVQLIAARSGIRPVTCITYIHTCTVINILVSDGDASILFYA